MTPNLAQESPEPEPEVTGVEQHRAWYAKDWPPVERVRDDIVSIPLPVPGNPIRYTLAYLLVGGGEAVLVDPGWDSDEGEAALDAGLATAGLGVEGLSGVVLSHVHPDHHGLTRRLLDRNPGLWVGMHPAERDALTAGLAPAADRLAEDTRWFAAAGVPPEELETLTVPPGSIRFIERMPLPTRLLADGELLPLAGRRVQAVATPGHTPGHLCLLDEDDDVILTGDHILPRISPNVGLQPHSATPPLGPYLDSLERLAHVDHEVLPAHEWRFRGLPARVAQLQRHHAERLDELLALLEERGPLTAWELAKAMSWAHGWDALQGIQRRSAVAETIAHAVYLVQEGTALAHGEAPVRYAVAGPVVQSEG